MTIRYPQVLSHVASEQTWHLTEQDSMLYALCLGLGRNPLDQRTLPFVYEGNLAVVPTLPTVIAWTAAPTFAELGVNPTTALHGEQKIELHRPVRIPMTFTSRGRVLAVYDKGADRGAIIVTEQVLTDSRDGQRIATLTTTCFGRSEGGCGGVTNPAPAPHRMPARSPFRSIDFQTREDLALLYRLTGDRNPIHADPHAAARAGFPRPILHGACCFGITCRAVLEAFSDVQPASIASHEARFAAPVYPGETLTVDLWRDRNIVSFEARVKAREITVIKHGKTILHLD